MKSITSKMTTLHNGTVIPSLGYRVDKDNKDESHSPFDFDYEDHLFILMMFSPHDQLTRRIGDLLQMNLRDYNQDKNIIIGN